MEITAHTAQASRRYHPNHLMNTVLAKPAKPNAPPPALWNPNAAGLWSVLLTPTFGAWLHMKNWQALGDAQKAATSRAWAWGNVAMIVAFAVIGDFLPESTLVEAASRGAGIGLLVGWWLSIGRVQKQLVTARYSEAYPRRGWGKPLGTALLVLVALCVLAFMVFAMADLAGSASGSGGSPHL